MTETPTAQRTSAADTPRHRYTADLASEIERTWQQRWARWGTFDVANQVGSLAPADGTPVPADKMFVQDMFPYPSGEGLHVGHPLGYIATDVYARYYRMMGRNVLHALGFDAFGLPAEQYAIQTGTHPRTRTEANVVNFRRQLGRLGLGHDSRRSFSTTDVDYYKWTQWIFLQIFNAWFDSAAGRARPIAELIAEFEAGTRSVGDGRSWSGLSGDERADVVDAHRLVYLADSVVNWCPGLGTVLANEEVTAEGRSERGNFPVFRKRLRQWMMRITAYSDRLLEDLDSLDWPEKVKTMQRNWIGRSTGATVLFAVDSAPGAGDIEVFTTRPDTLFGATYLVLAPEHELVDQIIAQSWPTGIDSRWTFAAATPADAVGAYEKAIDIRFQYALAYYDMGVALNALEQYPEAIVAFRRAVAAKPETDTYYRRLADAEPVFEWKDNISPYKKPVAIKADVADSYLGMALSYDKLQQYPEAVDALKKATDLKPDSAEAYYRLAEVHEKLDENIKAVIAYEMFLSLEKTGQNADTARNRIDELSEK